jgi:hypothetical protein
MRHFHISFVCSLNDDAQRLFQSMSMSGNWLNSEAIKARIREQPNWKDATDIVILGIYEFESEREMEIFYKK